MGAGQIGGFATLRFLGRKAEKSEAQYIVYYLSHAMMFCVGIIIEANVVLTPASCVFGEKYKFEIFAGTHLFLENTGISRIVNNICMHKGYNHTMRWKDCNSDNLALMILDRQFSFYKQEEGADYIINRVRYGVSSPSISSLYKDRSCKFYGWGSRRNGYLIPLLIHLFRMDVTVLPPEYCGRYWNYQNKYLCIRQPHCKSETYGALCPDDVGSAIVCSGFAIGMMTSRLVDRPCGVGFSDLTKYSKFLTCGVDDSRDVIDHEAVMEFDYTTKPLFTLHTVPKTKDVAVKTKKKTTKSVSKRS
ncbi:azurocidin-like isoform X2 [Battus philenor]|uniref:azurocidin-like isoform X2 n=1 Tax=Battus philenor TaxID=42288 RepID=UPI0035D0595C